MLRIVTTLIGLVLLAPIASAADCGGGVYKWPDCNSPSIIVGGDISGAQGGVVFGEADENGGWRRREERVALRAD